MFHFLTRDGKYFQPTYEELKPRIVDDTIKHFVDFQPTYEELKHRTKRSLLCQEAVFPAYL